MSNFIIINFFLCNGKLSFNDLVGWFGWLWFWFYFKIFIFQVNQYHRLKEEAGKLSARYLQDLDSVNREQKSDQDRLDNESRIRGEIENQLRQRKHELEETQKRSDKLTDHIRTTETALEEQKKFEGELGTEVESSKNQIDTLQVNSSSIQYSNKFVKLEDAILFGCPSPKPKACKNVSELILHQITPAINCISHWLLISMIWQEGASIAQTC